jgi:type II secretory pathway pseudopilin PulG
MHTHIQKEKGFTIIELLTSVSIFIVIMTISMGAILSVFNANRKAEALKTVMDNLNFSVETMSREIRFGTKYHCEMLGSTGGSFTSPQNCVTSPGGQLISFLASDGVSQITYRLNGTSIEKSINGGGYIAVTAPEITIQSLSFYVTGTNPAPGDTIQPKVLIKIRGSAGTKAASYTDFTLQTLVSQRLLDN